MINKSKNQLLNSTPNPLLEKNTISEMVNLYMDSFSQLQDFLSTPSNMTDVDFLKTRFENNKDVLDIRTEIFKINLEEVERIIRLVESSKEVFDKFVTIYEMLEVPTDDLKISTDVSSTINSEYINASTGYKTKKGTRESFYYVYDLMEKTGLQSLNSEPFFSLKEGVRGRPDLPFAYTVETSLYREVYKQSVLPLTHPVGFDVDYERIIFINLFDHYGLTEIEEIYNTTLTCYGFEEGDIKQDEIIKSKIFGELVGYEISYDQTGREKIYLDYTPLDNSIDDGFRLLRDYNGLVTLFDRQRSKVVNNYEMGIKEILELEIEEIKLVDETQGYLTITWVEKTVLNETYTVLEEFYFTEYTIIDREYVYFKFRIKGDYPDYWNYVKFPLYIKAVNQDNIKVFEPEGYTRDNILDYSSYNGRIEKTLGYNCRIDYNLKKTYIVETVDVHKSLSGIRPANFLLARDRRDIVLKPELIAELLAEGKDPYEKYYSNVDHTLVEIDTKYPRDYWGRKDVANMFINPKIGWFGYNKRLNSPHIKNERKINYETGEVTIIEDGNIEELVIGGPWNIGEFGLHYFDKGWNDVKQRWEQSWQPEPEADLALLNTTNTLSRYIWDNLDTGAPVLDSTVEINKDYVAWENYSEVSYIQMFKREIYCLDGGEWFINNDGNNILIGECRTIGIIPGTTGENVYGYSTTVEADVFRSNWNYYIGYDNLSFVITLPPASDTIEPFEDDSYVTVEFGAKLFNGEDTDDYNDNKLIQRVIDDISNPLGFCIGDNVFLKRDDYFIEGDFSFGVYRENADGEWETVADNNYAAY